MATLVTVLFWWAIVLLVGLLGALWANEHPERARALAAEARRSAAFLRCALVVRAEEAVQAVRRWRGPAAPQ